NKIAVDSVSQLIKVHPPAKTQLIISQKTTDNFGSSFVNELRKRGYSITETYIENKKINNEKKNTTKNNTGIPISYILDKFSDANYYRVTINIGNQSISRLYENNNNTVIPAGYWVMKE
ncbi:conjugal transfer protein TrbH, partial [Proteus mirabilis]